eukprot:Amastigsp_a180682_32.p2 type:complete len:238 gc:universal Amastigsp_a180682_32:337-1050(+)
MPSAHALPLRSQRRARWRCGASAAGVRTCSPLPLHTPRHAAPPRHAALRDACGVPTGVESPFASDRTLGFSLAADAVGANVAESEHDARRDVRAGVLRHAVAPVLLKGAAHDERVAVAEGKLCVPLWVSADDVRKGGEVLCRERCAIQRACRELGVELGLARTELRVRPVPQLELTRETKRNRGDLCPRHKIGLRVRVPAHMMLSVDVEVAERDVERVSDESLEALANRRNRRGPHA